MVGLEKIGGPPSYSGGRAGHRWARKGPQKARRGGEGGRGQGRDPREEGACRGVETTERRPCGTGTRGGALRRGPSSRPRGGGKIYNETLPEDLSGGRGVITGVLTAVDDLLRHRFLITTPVFREVHLQGAGPPGRKVRA